MSSTACSEPTKCYDVTNAPDITVITSNENRRKGKTHIRTIRIIKNNDTGMKKICQILLALSVCSHAWATTVFSISSQTVNNQTTFTVTRIGDMPQQTVFFRTVSLSAMEGQHFTANTGILNFPAGQVSAQVPVPELTPSGMYHYQQAGTTRDYRFEVVDENGLVLAHLDRAISYDSEYQIDPAVVLTEQGVTLTGDTFKVTDSGYDKNGYHGFPLSQYFAATAPQQYMLDMGYQLEVRVRFNAWEWWDGYQYVQILANQTSNCDNRSGCKDGDPGNINYSGYLGGFGHDPGDYWPFDESYIFPVTYLGNDCGPADDAWWPECSNGFGKLYNQKFNFSGGYGRAASGKLIVPTNLTDLGVRFNASGKHEDTWYAAVVTALLTAVDTVNPTVVPAEIVVSPGPYHPGNTVTISIPFSEIVSFDDTIGGLVTSWGVMRYAGGNGTNVLSFRGTIVAPENTLLKVNRFTRGISDMAGNLLSDRQIGQALNVQVAAGGQSTDETFLFSDFTPIGYNEAEDVAATEHFYKLVDGDKGTKWCSHLTGSPLFVAFQFPTPIVVTGYVLTTGNDILPFNYGRNPKTWTLKGKLNKDDEWTVLDSKKQSYMLPYENLTDVYFGVANTTASYRFFRLEISENGGADVMELSELQLEAKLDAGYLTNLVNATVTGVEPYYRSGQTPTISPVLISASGDTLVQDEHYSLAITPNPYTTAGDYTLTATAIPGSGYTGSKTVNFSIVDVLPIQQNVDTLTSGEYVVNSDVTLTGLLTINGKVTINLDNTFCLTAPQGILVAAGDTLIINGPGKLIAHSTNNNAGIGSAKTASACGTIIINSGQIEVNQSGSCYAVGLADDNIGSGSLTLGWKYSSDYIQIASLQVPDIHFASDQLFVVTGTTTTATTADIEGHKLIPATDFMRRDLTYATFQGLQSEYYFTGREIVPQYDVVDLYGNILEKDVDYTEHFLPSPICATGTYLLQVASINGSGYTYSKHQTFDVVLPDPQPIQPRSQTLVLGDEADNDAIVSASNDSVRNVMLADRILYRNGHWSTLCLPFDLPLAGSILDSADVRALTGATFEAGTLTLNFSAENVVTALTAGVPYIIRWTDTDKEDIVSPTFRGVTVNDTVAEATFPHVRFLGSYSAVSLSAADHRKLYLSENDTLDYPSADMVLGACRAHFALSEGAQAPEHIVLNFDGGTTDLEIETPAPITTKFLRDGQLFILKDGMVYDALGRPVCESSTNHILITY